MLFHSQETTIQLLGTLFYENSPYVSHEKSISQAPASLAAAESSSSGPEAALQPVRSEAATDIREPSRTGGCYSRFITDINGI